MKYDDVSCNECGTGMRWGEEYQLKEGGDDNALCADCWHDRDL